MFSSTAIKKDTFITEYTGEVLHTNSQVYKIRNNLYRKSFHIYMFKLGPSRVIDATQYASWGRYINHSCLPNCSVEEWNQLSEDPRILIFAN